MAFAASSSSYSSEINVTPLIDVLLVLLIIFMVVAPVTPRGLDSSIPQGKASPANTLAPVVLRLLSSEADHSTRYEIARQDIPQGDLAQRLRGMFAIREDRSIFIQADRKLSYSEVALAVSDAREAGAGAVVLSGLH